MHLKQQSRTIAGATRSQSNAAKFQHVRRVPTHEVGDGGVSDSNPNRASYKYLSQQSFKIPEYRPLQIGAAHLYRSAPKKRSWSFRNRHACELRQRALSSSFLCQWSLIWRSTSTFLTAMATYLTDSTCHLGRIHGHPYRPPSGARRMSGSECAFRARSASSALSVVKHSIVGVVIPSGFKRFWCRERRIPAIYPSILLAFRVQN